MIDPAAIPVVDIVEPDTVRLISTAHIDEPALAPLADTEADLAALEALEVQTSARHPSGLQVPDGIDPRELLTAAAGYGWTYVNAAFCHTRTAGNRFNGPERGAWYAAYGVTAVDTARAEVAWHLTRELDAVGVYDNLTAYRELVAGFVTRLHDLSGYRDEPFLAPDPETAYPAGQALARDLHLAGANGVIYPSVRRPGGRCLAAFRPGLVQNIRQGATWAFHWSGRREPEIRPL